MSKLNRSEQASSDRNGQRLARFWRSMGTMAMVLALVLVPSIEANGSGAQRAIENLEGCSKQERSSNCVKILKRESAGKGKQRVKAQIRGGRIIWYEFDQQSGQVRRAN